MSTSGPSPVRRSRRTNAELDALDDAIVTAVRQEHPVSLRGVYYRTVSAGAVDKTELGYRAVGRRLLALRRAGRVPYSSITDGTRWVIRPASHRGIDAALDDLAASYRRQLWRDQPVEVHVFVEKDAISGELVEGAILEHVDPHQLTLTRTVEAAERQGLRALAEGGLR